ncbi:hypothetical protein HN51_053350 [Arachis hypogaea]|uniref:CUE domain-containing protein n=1 Tax=Arachis hypogaea TaxID=3818 RepID=A0A444XC28_ARAHY|nr:uncharacterized protein LOC107616917 [Arachis ipaensis]XP_025676751.1 uncharacterized protein LOC112776730 [Arachis hypogaea]QHN75679.1 uncharacterized protein DS421_19g637360 [Arachis hypogaea]RYQ87246.1 hypothetical protein Ahy_B09g094722 [Arachis hypogaea]
MSAAVCGIKRSFFDELASSPALSKKLRYSSSSIRFAPPSLIDRLRTFFPHMDEVVLERALEECGNGNDLDAAIKRLNELCLGTTDAEEPQVEVNEDTDDGRAAASASDNLPPVDNLPKDGAEWVDFFVRGMMVATSVDDARARAATMLEALEKSISGRVRAEATNVQKENLLLKEQIQVLIKERNSFKNAFRIQHERFSDYDQKNQELQQLKQLASQYQQQIRTLEVNNYALAMHLKQAQQSNPFPGHFPPDVF